MTADHYYNMLLKTCSTGKSWSCILFSYNDNNNIYLYSAISNILPNSALQDSKISCHYIMVAYKGLKVTKNLYL